MKPRDAISEQELRARAAELAQVPVDESAPAPGRALLIVTVDAARVGLDVSMVREVVAHPEVTPLPLTPRSIAGLMNLRYEILPVLDLGALRGGVARGQRQFAVVVEDHDLAAAVLVDDIADVSFETNRDALPVLSASDVLHHADLRPFRGEDGPG